MKPHETKANKGSKGKPQDQPGSDERDDEPLSTLRDKEISDTLARVPKEAQPLPNEKRGKFNYTKSSTASKTRIQIQCGA